MNYRREELEYLSAWSREEKQADPYILPAHQLQAIHRISGATIIRLIKAWARSEGRRDEDIFDLHQTAAPSWPWPSNELLVGKLDTTDAEQPV